MKQLIADRARQLGFDACRFASAAPPSSSAIFQEWLQAGWHGQMAYLARNAHKRVDPQQVLPGVRSLIVLAASYQGAIEPAAAAQPLPPAARSGMVARYARHADYHDVLGARLRELAALVDGLEAGAQSRWYVDTGPVLERDLAQRAGIGFIGKHTNLISRTGGNWILLAEILTTVALEPDVPEKNRCGTCTRCLTACPTQAITAPFRLDARRCISYLTIELKDSIPLELRAAVGNRIYGCDDCLAICPWNRFAREGQLMKAHARADLESPDLLELLELDATEFKRRFADTPILRAKRRGFLRNVCVALGNVGDAGALPALARAASDPEPLIAEHASWARDQIIKRSRQPNEPRQACV